MKKYLFFAVAALAMTGCSQDEVMEVAQKEAISFKDAFVENATRAIDATYNNENKPTSFLVYGNTQGNEENAPVVPIFKGVEVSNTNTTGVGDAYKYDAQYTQYWIADNTYNFAAVVDATTVTTGTDGLPTTIAYDATEQKDLLYASAADITEKPTNGEVGFTFDHLLSKAMFTVKNTMTSNTADYMYTYRVTNVCINNAVLIAEYTVANKTWGTAKSSYTKDNALSFGDVTENTTTTNGTTALLIGEVGKAAEATSHYQRVLIPAVYTYNEEDQTGGLNITCKIETLLNGSVVDSQDYNKTIDYTFEAGNAYNFVISLALDEPIKFTVSKINEWKPENAPTDITMPEL